MRRESPETKVSFLMVSWTMPPNASGSSVIVRNLLRWFEPEEAVLLGQVPFAGRIALTGIENHHRITIPSYRIYWRVKPWIEPLYTIPLAVRAGVTAVRRYQLQAVVAVFPNALFLWAGYLIARGMGLPFLLYMHNLYAETRRSKIGWLLAKALQRHLFAKGSAVFSMSEGMAQYLADHYYLPTIPLVHAINEPIPQVTRLPRPTVPFKVGFSGNINPGVEGPLRNVIKAIGGKPDYLIVLHTPVHAGDVRTRLGLWADNIVTRDERDTADLVRSLKSCDMLVLGLTNGWSERFETDCRTQFPTRTLEMLISERPILVLCPQDYYLAQFFKMHECGLVVSRIDPESVRDGVDRLCVDVHLRATCVANALKVAHNFRGDRVAALLRRKLEESTKRDRNTRRDR